MARSIKRDFQYLSVITIIVTMCLLAGIWVYYDFRDLQLESVRIRDKYMQEYKGMLRYQVERIVSEIKHEHLLTEEKLRDNVKARTEDGWSIAHNLIVHNKETMSDKTLKNLIRDSLQDIRLINSNGYFFALNLDGKVELSSIEPALQGKNHIRYKTSWNSYEIDEVIKIATTQGEGFLQYKLHKQDGFGKEDSKISYVKYLPHLNWIVGSGVYLSDFTTEFQNRIVQRIEQVRFGKEGKDYVFATTMEGVGKTFPATGKNMLEIRDSNGLCVVKELIEKAKAGGGFVQYVMPSLKNITSKPKLSYSAPIPEWNWYIGAGIYIDEIQTAISANQQLFRDRVQQHIKMMLGVLVSLLTVHMLIAHYISRKIWGQIELFSQFFRRASTEFISMESEVIEYREFQEIGHLANNMLRDRNRILQEISLSRDEWVNTFNAIGDCLFIVDNKGIIEKANATAVNLFKMPEEQMISMLLSDLCSHDNPVNVTLIDHRPHTAEIENQILGKIFLASSFPLFDADDKLSRIIHIARDITEQKIMENQLHQAQKMEALGTLAGGIAHDFNNILAAILGYSELAQKVTPQDAKVSRYLERVQKAGLRAKDLVRQILAFNRPFEAPKKIVRLPEILEESINLLRSTLPTTISIKQNIDSECGAVFADPTQIHQVIMNICTNAFHAMEEKGGILTVSLGEVRLNTGAINSGDDSRQERYIELEIGDSGPGIAPEVLDRIFDPFFTTKETGKGTGMGLTIVHGIVKSNGGKITCKSKHGTGTVFCINLPVVEKDVLPIHQAETVETMGEQRILFVDDEVMLAELNRTILEELGYDVTVFVNSVDALNEFKARPEEFDLVITDQTMPVLTGIDLAREILKVRPQLPIILCTGFSSVVSEHEALNAGIKEFVMKPLEREEIGVLIRKVIDESLIVQK